MPESNEAAATAAAAEGIAVVYDGDCPFCTQYVTMLRLKAVAGDVELVDARSDHDLAIWARRHFDLDDGMAVRIHGAWHTGSDAVHALALLTGPSSTLNRLHYAVFRHRRTSAAIYPFLRAGRNLALRLIGRQKIGEAFPK
jgi:predicted DCC family thiol-disulfide oxidoreductase YuxK